MYSLEKLRRMVENSADMTSEAREASERDRDFYDGYQLSAEERAILNKRKQPIVIVNRIKRKIDAMVGIEQRGRVDPRAFPREPGDEDAADLATKALVFVEETERVDEKRSSAFENLLIEGYGGVEICAEPDKYGWTPKVKRLRWEELFFDPHSREKDFSDASYMGVLKWMSLDAATAFAKKFSDKSDEQLADILDWTESTQAGETYEDRPRHEASFVWADKRQKRVRVAQMYYRHGDTWHLAVFTGKGELYNAESPYLDVDGKPECAIILMSAYVDRENRRYGLVRDMIPQQEETNKRRSKLLHSLNVRQTMGAKGAVDVTKVKAELAKPDGHVEWDSAYQEGGQRPFDIIPQTDQIQGQFALLQEAKSEIDMLGPNASLLGQLEGQQSGRAIMAQQQAGLAELAPIYDSLRDWTERVYRALWARIKQFWDAPRWIRVTEENEAPQFIGINVPQMTPYGLQVVNSVAELDVDIIIDQAPDYATLRAEQFEKLAEMAAQGYPIPPEAIIEASDLRDKKKILEGIKASQEAQAQQQMQAMQMQMQLEGQKAQGTFAKDMSAAQKNVADAQQTQVETMRLMRTPIVVRPAAGAA
jgi:hypothetical protein